MSECREMRNSPSSKSSPPTDPSYDDAPEEYPGRMAYSARRSCADLGALVVVVVGAVVVGGAVDVVVDFVAAPLGGAVPAAPLEACEGFCVEEWLS